MGDGWGEDLYEFLERNTVKTPLDLTNALRTEEISGWHPQPQRQSVSSTPEADPVEGSDTGLQATLERSSFSRSDAKNIGTRFEEHVAQKYGANKVDSGERDDEIGVASRLSGWPVQVKSCCYGVKQGDYAVNGAFKLRSTEDELGEKSLMVFYVYQPVVDPEGTDCEVLTVDGEDGSSFDIAVLGEMAVPTPVFHDSVAFDWWDNGQYEIGWKTVFGDHPTKSPVYKTLLSYHRARQEHPAVHEITSY